jgi:TfoX/Sxy family transcriptional regulator of competence genes
LIDPEWSDDSVDGSSFSGMGFDEGLAERARALIGTDGRMSERKMFGGLCFMTNGNMSFGIVGSDLMLRVGPDAYPSALAMPHSREIDFTGRSMRGMVYVDSEGTAEDDDLKSWLQRGLAFAQSLPPK